MGANIGDERRLVCEVMKLTRTLRESKGGYMLRKEALEDLC